MSNTPTPCGLANQSLFLESTATERQSASAQLLISSLGCIAFQPVLVFLYNPSSVETNILFVDCTAICRIFPLGIFICFKNNVLSFFFIFPENKSFSPPIYNRLLKTKSVCNTFKSIFFGSGVAWETILFFIKYAIPFINRLFSISPVIATTFVPLADTRTTGRLSKGKSTQSSVRFDRIKSPEFVPANTVPR